MKKTRLEALQAELGSLIRKRKELFTGDVNATEKELNDRVRPARDKLETAPPAQREYGGCRRKRMFPDEDYWATASVI